MEVKGKVGAHSAHPDGFCLLLRMLFRLSLLRLHLPKTKKPAEPTKEAEGPQKPFLRSSGATPSGSLGPPSTPAAHLICKGLHPQESGSGPSVGRAPCTNLQHSLPGPLPRGRLRARSQNKQPDSHFLPGEGTCTTSDTVTAGNGFLEQHSPTPSPRGQTWNPDRVTRGWKTSTPKPVPSTAPPPTTASTLLRQVPQGSREWEGTVSISFRNIT